MITVKAEELGFSETNRDCRNRMSVPRECKRRRIFLEPDRKRHAKDIEVPADRPWNADRYYHPRPAGHRTYGHEVGRIC